MVARFRFLGRYRYFERTLSVTGISKEHYLLPVFRKNIICYRYFEGTLSVTGISKEHYLCFHTTTFRRNLLSPLLHGHILEE
jgi:hypothetical protein